MYELPKDRVTSVLIASIIKEKANYQLTEPVQFRDCRPLPNGLPSDFKYGICKIESNSLDAVAKAIKYFSIDMGEVDSDGKPKLWLCRALPYDKDLAGVNRDTINTKHNLFVKNID